MNFSPLLTANFWFNLSPDPLMAQAFRFLQLFFIAMVILGVGAKILSIVKKSDYLVARGAKKFFGPLFWIGLFGPFLLLMDFERVTFFSSRFWYILWFAGLIVWISLIVAHLVKNLPARKKMIDEQKKLQKWLPKKR